MTFNLTHMFWRISEMVVNVSLHKIGRKLKDKNNQSMLGTLYRFQ